MAYLSKEEVSKMRVELKKVFPAKQGWKLSITRKDYSSINVKFFEAPINLDPKNQGNYSVNPYWLEENYKNEPELLKVFQDAKKAILGVKDQIDRNAGDPGADYGNTNFFYNISVGDWDRLFKVAA